MNTKLTKKIQGFTIIEVMIVLAIAGLILAIIFLAVPALQRSSRNTQRSADATHLGGLINATEANNNGKVPSKLSIANTPAAPATDTVYLGGESFSRWTPAAANFIVATTTAPVLPPADTLVVYSAASCTNGVPAALAGGGLIVVYAVEEAGNTGVIHCVAV
jgi:prepilin-type N-terminal cleavage/methylation domain-containing protein